MWTAEHQIHQIYRAIFQTFNKPSSGRTDWLCHPSVKLAVLYKIFGEPQSQKKILIPGIGHSTLAIELRNIGYDVTAADLNEEQVSETNIHFEPLYFFNLQEAVPSTLEKSFDYIVDSSVTDVFMQLTSSGAPNVSSAKKVHKNLHSMLKKDGVMIVFSMNNKPWDKIYNREYIHMNKMYMIIHPTINYSTKSGRNISYDGEDVLVLVASTATLSFNTVNVNSEYGSITEWSTTRPEVHWNSQRD